MTPAEVFKRECRIMIIQVLHSEFAGFTKLGNSRWVINTTGDSYKTKPNGDFAHMSSGRRGEATVLFTQSGLIEWIEFNRK